MSEGDFSQRLENNPGPVIVDLWAPWCLPCRAIEPVMKALRTEYAGRVDLWMVNVDDEPDVLRALGVYGVPTVIAYQRDREVARHTGSLSREALKRLFDAALTGVVPAKAIPSPVDRILRLGAGLALILLAWRAGLSGAPLLLALLGVVVAFTAVYDRCPIYRAVSWRLNKWLGRQPSGQART